jgi:hypothetical protein
VRPARAALLIGLAAAGLAAPGCGKKGPPLEPLLRVPGRATDIAALRVGDTVSVTFTIPSANIDETKPADIARVDLFAYTAMEPGDVRDPRRMTLVGSIPVRKPPEPPEPQEAKAGDEHKPPKPPGPPAPPEPGEDQGAVVTLTETLTADMLVPVAPDKKPPVLPSAEPVTWFGDPRVGPLAGPVPKPEPRRFYLVYGVSRAGHRGGVSPRPAVPLGQPPAAPPQPSLAVTEGGIVVTWSVPPGARLPYQEPAAGDVLAATTRGMEAAPALAYLVYRLGAKGPVRLTEKPVSDRTFTDQAVAFGTEGCYDVRTVVGQGNVAFESQPSPAACVTPADTFPPAAPTSLAAVAGQGVISLIWVGVDAADLAGYLVLRGDAPSGELTPLFEAPISQTTYRDVTARPGVRHVYAVVAVDKASPPNRSARSNTVEETAR